MTTIFNTRLFRSINEFPLKSELMIHSFINGGSFSPYRNFNRQYYSSIYFNKRTKAIGYIFNIEYKKKNVDGSFYLKPINIENFLLNCVDDLYIEPKNISKPSLNKYIDYLAKETSKLSKICLYNLDTSYELDFNSLYLFVRLVAKNRTDLNVLSMLNKCSNVYLLSNGVNNPLNSLGFICKLNNRIDYKFTNVNMGAITVEKSLNIIYPFLKRKYINNFIFDKVDSVFLSYKIEKHLLYMPTLKKATKAGISILNGF